MQLTKLALRNYRACEETIVDLAPDLTLLVGENASGKTAMIDALRLVTYPASGRQSAWFSVERDLTHGVQRGEPVAISARYESLTEDEQAVYLAQLVDADDSLTYTASFATSPAIPRRNTLTWAIGAAHVEDPEPGTRRRIAHVYLPPLRDAVRDLDGGDGNQLHEVIRILLGGDQAKEDDFVSTARSALDQIAKHPLAVATRQTIQEYFSQTTPPQRDHRVELAARDLELHRVARLLRLQLAEAQVPVGDISATGLGYANLLYIAMVVLGLVRAAEYDLTLLLVEEPEAHLHPQLQLVLLDFLRQQASESGKNQQGLAPAGRVQVIATTHSPNLVSAVSIKNVVVVSRRAGKGRWLAAATSLAALGLQAAAVRKIDRYLNATRGALLFGRQVILVEGTAEMMLLPALAKKHLEASSATSPKDDASKQRLRQFRSVTLVSVEGVDFEPYLHLLLDGLHPRVDQVVVVTDGDKDGSGRRRAAAYAASFPAAVGSGALLTCVGGTTLEAEFFRIPKNEQLLKETYLALHPKSEAKWQKVADLAGQGDSDSRAAVFARALDANDESVPSLDISKGDFAHLIAEALELPEGSQFETPPYLIAAIEAVTRLQTPVGPPKDSTPNV